MESLQWRHNEHVGVSNHQSYDWLLNRLFRGRSKKSSKLRVTGLCAGNSPVTGEFPSQSASYAEKTSIWRCHHDDTTPHVKYVGEIATFSIIKMIPAPVDTILDTDTTKK